MYRNMKNMFALIGYEYHMKPLLCAVIAQLTSLEREANM